MSYPKPEIGYYYAECCLLDLYQIKTQEQLAGVMERIADNDECGPLKVYATIEDAIGELGGELDAYLEQNELARLGYFR